jgi:hypothetical protein
MIYENGKAPLYPLVNLQWFAGEDGLVDLEGQGEPAPAEGGQGEPVATAKIPSAKQSVSESYFYKHPETGDAFKTKEELNKAWKQSYMMRSDYSKKTADLSGQKKQHEQDRQTLEKERREWQEQMKRDKEEMATYDKIIRQNPKLYPYLKQLRDQGNSGFDQSAIEKLIDQKYGDKFKKIEQWENENYAKTQQEEAFNKMALMYEDFDKDSVQKSYDELLSANSIDALMEILHYAHKGRSYDPVGEQREFTQKLQKKQAGKLVSSEGSKAGGKPKAFRSIDEARMAAQEAEKNK